MKFYDAPEIYVLAKPHMDTPRGWSEFTSNASTHGDALVEIAGRACYWSYGKGRRTNEEYIQNIVDSGHGSVLEHPTWTFGLKGISRSLSHELVRHRHLSFSQLSQRYVSEQPEFVVPPGLDDRAKESFIKHCKSARSEYVYQLGEHPDTKAGREVARSVLPNCTATRIVVTGNARTLRQMLALRGSPAADAEFRRLAVAWTRLMKQLAPNIFEDFSVHEVAQGEYVWARYTKV